MTATCPNNPKHKRFITTAHEAHDWKVDEHGEFIKDMGNIEVTHGPTIGNCWTCATCGAEATVTND